MRHVLMRPTTVAPVVFVVGSLYTSAAALAQCGTGAASANAGFGPPSISITESSTAQVLEEVRRRQVASLSQPGPQSTAAQPTAPPPQQQAAQTPSSQQAPSGQQAQPAPSGQQPSAKKGPASKQPATPEPQDYETAYNSEPIYRDKGFYEGDIPRERRAAVWGRGFLGWDRHSNLAPGQQENPTRKEVTGGGFGGADWAVHKSENHLTQVGAFGGFVANDADFSDTQFILVTPDAGGDTTNLFARSGNSQDINGGFVGGYLNYRENQWLADVAFKVDILNLSQKSDLTQLASATGGGALAPCGGTPLKGVQSGDSSATTFLLAANLANRIPHGNDHWIAPTGGFRYWNTSFGNNASVINFSNGTSLPGSLGLEDGQALRLQGGVRFGGIWTAPNGDVWETEIGALLFSDVWVDGFNFTSTSGGVVSPVDQGKVRALGQLMTKVDVGNGLYYIGQGEIYGGEDLFGVAGQIGVRQEW